jgi:hypothetical protein
MAVVPDGAPDGVVASDITPSTDKKAVASEKRELDEKLPDVETISERATESESDEYAKIYEPDDNEEFIDPRLKDYPIPLVAKTVDLHNDFE